MANVKLLVVPRWGGSADHDFYPWLRAQLSPLGVATECLALDRPPTIEHAVTTLRPIFEAAPADSVILGHSVGVQAAMRALATCHRDAPLAALVAVAGWFTVDRPWPELLPWQETRFDHARTRAAVRTVRVLVSTNDPFTADFTATRRLFEEHLGAVVDVVPDAKHFNAAEEPAVLRAVRDILRL